MWCADSNLSAHRIQALPNSGRDSWRYEEVGAEPHDPTDIHSGLPAGCHIVTGSSPTSRRAVGVHRDQPISARGRITPNTN